MRGLVLAGVAFALLALAPTSASVQFGALLGAVSLPYRTRRKLT